jgi:outer membrane protein
MRRIFLAVVSVFLIVSGARAQATRLSLDDCMNYALKHNYTLKNAHLDIQIQQAQVDQTKALALPKVNGKVDFNYFNIPQRSFIDGSTFPGTPPGTPSIIVPITFTVPYGASAGITTSQILFDGGVLVALQARNTVMELARQGSRLTEENLRYNIFKAYNSLVIAYRQYDILKSSLSYARSLLHDVEVTKESGFAEKMDVDRTSVQVNNLAADSIRIGNVLNLTEQVLKFQIGMDINAPIVLTDTNIEANKQLAAKLVAEVTDYDRVAEYGLLKTQIMLNEFNVKRYKLAALPTLAGFWAYGTNYGSNKFSDMVMFNKYWASSTLGLSLTVPIFNGLSRVNQVKEAQLNVDKTHNSIENMKQVIDFQTAQARTSIKNAVLQVQTQGRNVELANSVLDLSRKKYKAGVGSNLEVTQAQTDQLRAQSNYFTALLDMVNAEADLKKALGLMK